jgi:uncharacterized protein YceK
MNKIVILFLLIAVLAVTSGCTTFKGGSSSNYPASNYPQNSFGGSHSGHSH